MVNRSFLCMCALVYCEHFTTFWMQSIQLILKMYAFYNRSATVFVCSTDNSRTGIVGSVETNIYCSGHRRLHSSKVWLKSIRMILRKSEFLVLWELPLNLSYIKKKKDMKTHCLGSGDFETNFFAENQHKFVYS